MNVSWSLLRLYETCPFAAKLIRVDRVPREKNYQKRFLTGTAGHRFLQRWSKRGFDNRTRSWEVGVIVDIVAAQTGIEWIKQSERNRYKWRAIKEASLLMKAVRHNGIDKIASLEFEKRLSASLEIGHSMGGIADMVADDGDWILEMKMSSDPRWAEPGQLIFYGCLFKMAKNRIPARLSFFLPLNQTDSQIIDLKFNDTDFESMYQRINSFIDCWARGDFPSSKNAKVCNECPVQSSCKNAGDGKTYSSPTGTIIRTL